MSASPNKGRIRRVLGDIIGLASIVAICLSIYALG